MCFWKTPKIPEPRQPAAIQRQVDATPAPAPEIAKPPSPAPVITPSKVQGMQTQDERRRKLRLIRYGMLSTIKTSPQGITGTGSNLISSGTGKSTLGA